jgi:hypothetical protein
MEPKPVGTHRKRKNKETFEDPYFWYWLLSVAIASILSLIFKA